MLVLVICFWIIAFKLFKSHRGTVPPSQCSRYHTVFLGCETFTDVHSSFSLLYISDPNPTDLEILLAIYNTFWVREWWNTGVIFKWRSQNQSASKIHGLTRQLPKKRIQHDSTENGPQNVREIPQNWPNFATFFFPVNRLTSRQSHDWCQPHGPVAYLVYERTILVSKSVTNISESFCWSLNWI